MFSILRIVDSSRKGGNHLRSGLESLHKKKGADFCPPLRYSMPIMLLFFSVQESTAYFVCAIIIWYVFECRYLFRDIEVGLLASAYRTVCSAQSHCVCGVYGRCIEGFLRRKTVVDACKGHDHLHVAAWGGAGVEIRCHCNG